MMPEFSLLRGRPSGRSILALGGAVALLLLTLGYRFATTIDRIREVEAETRVLASQAALVERLIASLVDAETGQRGFLLTDESGYLRPYYKAQADVPALIGRARLAALPGINMEEFAAKADARMAELRETVQLAEEDRIDEAIAIVDSDQGTRLMYELRGMARLAEVELNEKSKVAIAVAEAEYRSSLVALTALTVIGMLTVLGGFWFLTRQLASREASEKQVRYWSSRVETLAELTSRTLASRDADSVTQVSLEDVRRLVPAASTVLVKMPDAGEDPEVARSGKPVEIPPAVLAALAEAMVAQPTGQFDREGIEQAAAVAGIAAPDVELLTSMTDSVLAVPLKNQALRIEGVMLALAAPDRQFTNDDFLLFRQFASAVGTAMLNARLNDQLNVAAARKDEFLAMLGHELRNPLSAVRSSADAIESGSEECFPELFAVIQRQTRQMSRLVDDLLDVARVARGKVHLDRELIDMSELVPTVATDVFAAIGREDDLRLTSPESVLVLADHARMTQCVSNLLHNAIKFSPIGTPITVSVSVEKDECVIDVRDEGVGIDSADLRDIFDAFRQTDHDVSRSAGGLGLGLAVVKGLVRLHGGRITATSAGRGRGSTFTIRLPRVAAERVRSAKPRPDAVNLSGVSVLAIDDSPDVLLPIRVLLSEEGCRVATAADGDAGIAAARRIVPDVILCDIGLPGDWDGYRVIREVRADPALQSVYTVAVTGYGQPQDRETSREAGFDYHFTKPVSRDELVRVVGQRPRFLNESKRSQNAAS